MIIVTGARPLSQLPESLKGSTENQIPVIKVVCFEQRVNARLTRQTRSYQLEYWICPCLCHSFYY